MNNKYSLQNIDPVNVGFLILSPICALVGTYYWLKIDGFNWGLAVMGIVFYFMTGLSITAGYHRLFAHRTYDAHPLIKLFYLLFGAAAFQNSALKWCADHRLHHFEVDTENDPYSIQEGFFYAHMGWIFLKKNSEVKEKFAKDLRHDPMLAWQHKYFYPIAIGIGFVLPTILGWVFFDSALGGLFVGGFLRIVFTHHCTFFINSLCHCLGTTPYTDTNSAKDSWFMAFLTFGEGYHNFHHYFQTDYRNGIRWFQWDPTKWMIRSLSFVGLASKLRSTSQDKILAARMQMKMKMVRLQANCGSSDKFLAEVERMKQQVLEAYKKLQELKKEYKFSKSTMSPLNMSELRARIIVTKAEFEATRGQWEFLVNNWARVLVHY